MPENLNNFSITDTDMQTILDDLAVDMDQILAELNFDDEGFSDWTQQKDNPTPRSFWRL